MLFFTSPIGLGHASRDVAIATKLASKAGSIKFVSGQPATEFIAAHGFDVMDLYHYRQFDMEQGEFKNRLGWLRDYVRYYKECKEKARSVIASSKPNLIVADEDFAAVAVSEGSGIPRVLITDIFESRFAGGLGAILEHYMNKAARKIMKSAELVIIPFEGKDHDNMAFVGPIVREPTASREELRERFGFARRTILLTVGGTNAGLFLIEMTLPLLKKACERHDADVVIVGGPSLNFQTNDARCYGYVRDMHDMVFASDLVVSLAGRSTSDEADAYGTPAILIPIKRHSEQEENAKRHGFTFEDIRRIDELVAERLNAGRKNVNMGRGAERACELIANLL